MEGRQIDLSAVAGNDSNTGVKNDAALLAFTDAVMARDAGAIVTTRDRVVAELGDEAVTEAAAVIAMFNIVDRIADATGIPVDEGFAHDARYQIGEELGMGHLTPEKRSSQ
jgi:alkylhydroperoxidase family enzyme